MASPFRRGVALFHQGRLAAARRLLREALAVGGPGSGWAAEQLVQTFVQKGRAGSAGSALRQARVADESLRELGLGYLRRVTGRPDLAVPFLERAAAGGDGAEAARIELASLRGLAGRAEEGVAELFRCESRLRRRHDGWGVAAALARRAALWVEQGRSEEAAALALRAAALRERCGDRLGVGLSLLVRAKALYRLARYADAFRALEQALAVHERAGHDHEAAVGLNNIGLWHLDLANPAQAVERFRAARSRFHRQGDGAREGAVLANLGNAYRQLNDLPRAARAYRQALAMLSADGGESRGIAVAELAEVESRRGAPAVAAALLARELPRLAGASAGTRGLCQVALGRARLGLGDLDGALAAAARARAAVSRLAPETLARRSCEIRAGLVRALALIRAGRRGAAARELGRTESALDALLVRQRSAWVRMGLAESYREAHDALLQSRLGGGARGERLAWQESARCKARELRRSARPRPPRAPGARTGERTLLEYHVGAETTHVFVIRAGRVRVVDLGLSERALAGAVRRLLEPLRAAGATGDPRPDLAHFDLAAAHRLHRAILAPALDQLAEPPARLVVVPDGPLHALPFELLVTDAGRRAPDAGSPLARFAGARYAVEEHDLSYARSSLLIAGPLDRSRPPRSFLGMSYSPRRHAVLATTAGPLPLGPLGGARQEVEAIGAMFPRSSLLHGEAALVSRYHELAPRHEVVHIAAHAFADWRAPGSSGIVLAEGAGGRAPGYLTAEAVAQVPIAARLVTLSACDSGWGALRTREGALGLSRAFLEAGAESVLATLWPVDDRAAVDLMCSFYRRLRAGEDRSKALAGAKREMREDCGRHLFPPRAHPYYWAGFVLVDHRPGA